MTLISCARLLRIWNVTQSRKLLRMASRPAQGNNSIPARKPRPSYVKDGAPRVVSVGTLSRPKPAGASFKGSRLVADATPKVVQS